MTTETKVFLCNDDFYDMLAKACEQAGGGDVLKMRRMAFEDVVQMVARNGLRMVYMADKHMDSLHVEWNAKYGDLIKNRPPTKRELLTDAQQREDDDEELNK